jgi:predicted DNA-binding transcriptional regulator AlpA
MAADDRIALDAKQASERLGLSMSTLAKLRLSGEGPAYAKLGRRVVYRPADLAAWVEANRFKSTSEYGEAQR